MSTNSINISSVENLFGPLPPATMGLFSEPAIQYITALFKCEDTLCLTFIHSTKKDTHGKALVKNIFTRPIDIHLADLIKQNSEWHIYVSMAPFKPETKQRIKQNISEIRHVFLEIDEDGDRALENIRQSVTAQEIPPLTIVVESSPHKYQVIWNVTGFTIETQEAMNRALMLKFGGDPQSVDAARVLRIAGFKNLKPKYDPKPTVTILERNEGVYYTPEDFHISVEPPQSSAERTVANNEQIQSIVDRLTDNMDKANVNYYRGRPWGGGILFELQQCPWCETHTDGNDKGAVVIVQASGALAFMCQHAHCDDKNWEHFRTHLESQAGAKLQFAPPTPGIVFTEQKSTAQIETPSEVVKAAAIEVPDMSEAVLDGRLGEVCQALTPTFPRIYAWLAVVTAASAMMPQLAPTIGTEYVVLGAKEPRSNLYTTLVGPIGSGKSKSIEWACAALGLRGSRYLDAKAGSAEGLLIKLADLEQRGKLEKSLLVDVDEWKYYFKKAAIEGSSFMTILNTGFDKSRLYLAPTARRAEINLDCNLSWIGGIVQEEYSMLVSGDSLGGFYDRLFQGICPSDFHCDSYRPWEGEPILKDGFKPTPVTIDGSVYELMAQWRSEARKQGKQPGREVDISIRVALICTSFDGRSVLAAKDVEGSGATKATLDYQTWVRTQLTPNSGDNPDAQCANAMLAWLQAHAPNGEWVDMQELKRGVHYSRMRLGPVIFERVIRHLSSPITQAIEMRQIKRQKGYPQILVRLVV